MAFLEGLHFTGGLGDFSAYRMKGSNKIIIRSKGGASKEMIKNHPNFEKPRRNMKEFGGCSAMGSKLRISMGNVRNLADYNISGPINALLKAVQKQDQVSERGKRNISLSKFPGILEGFSFNQERPFDSIIRNPIACSISRETRSAVIDIPRLMPGVNFFPQNTRPMFSIGVALGTVPDFFFDERFGEYRPNEEYPMNMGIQEIYTAWMPVTKGMDALTLELEQTTVPPDDANTLVVTIGIRFGQVYGGGIVEQTLNTGAGKILAAK